MESAKSPTHVTVFADPKIYAGWPANHGGWQWGDEFLVGFLYGPFGSSAMHNIHEPMVKAQARSLDGGLSWKIEHPNVDFEASSVSEPSVNFEMRESIIRVCGNYDHGGEACAVEGGFYTSKDRGHTWEGAYSFKGLRLLFLDPFWNTSRTAYLGNLLFLSVGRRRHWGRDFVICVKHDGMFFHPQGIVCENEVRCVMPAVARVGHRIVVTARRRDGRKCWIDAFGSEDEGVSWRRLSLVTVNPGNNGNPPALISIGQRLVCAFGHRDKMELRYTVSDDAGETWHDPIVLRRGRESDIGYPRLFSRSDGRLVCVYYWSDDGEAQHIEASIFEI